MKHESYFGSREGFTGGEFVGIEKSDGKIKYRPSFPQYIIGLTAVVALGALVISNYKNKEINSEIAQSNVQFESFIYEGHKAFAGINQWGNKVAKIYSPIGKDEKGRHYVDMVGAADMNDDGIFQADELVDLRITKPNLMKILFLGNCPDKFGGDVSQFANPKSLEKVFDKVAHR